MSSLAAPNDAHKVIQHGPKLLINALSAAAIQMTKVYLNTKHPVVQNDKTRLHGMVFILHKYIWVHVIARMH